jgi:hypothetical protein
LFVRASHLRRVADDRKFRKFKTCEPAQLAILATAIGAVAVGAVAIGALAIRRLAIKEVAIERAKFKSLEIEDLSVKRLRAARVDVSDSLQLPPGESIERN